MNATTCLLVATDLSDAAQHAEQRAVQLAARLGARVVLLEVLEYGVLEALRRWLATDAEEPASANLERLQRRAEALTALAGVPVEARQRQGHPAVEILDEAEQQDAGLIVCGLRGSHTQRTPLHGSLPPRLARQTRRPLLVVRNPADADYQHILLCCDLSPAASHALAVLRRYWPAVAAQAVHVAQAPFEGKLELAGVAPQQIEDYRRDCLETARREFENWQKRQSAPLACRLLGPGYPPELLHRFAGEHATQLLTLSRTLGSWGRDALPGSVTLHLWEWGDCDLLLVPDA